MITPLWKRGRLTRASMSIVLLVLLSTAAQAALIQHLDSTVSGSINLGGSGAVNSWVDQSGSGNDAVKGRGRVFYPGTADSPTGLSMLDTRDTRNDLILFQGSVSPSLFDFGNGSSVNDGFTVAVVFRVDEMPGTDQYIIGTKHSGTSFSIRVRSNGTLTMKLLNNQDAANTTVALGDTIVAIASYKASSGQYKFWNSKGDTLTSGTNGMNLNLSGNGSPLRVGEAKTTGGSNNFLRGMVGEVRVYDTDLTSPQMFALQTELTEKWVTGATPPLPPVPPGPGFSNINGRVPGQMLCEVSTDNDGSDARTVVMDYINGYLLMESRWVASEGKSASYQVWDILDPAAPFEITGARRGSDGFMHTAVMMLPDYRVNRDRWVNIRDPLDILNETPPGYLVADLGTRSTSVIPYQYTNRQIYDSAIGESIADLTEHGFSGTPTPIGNLLIISGIRGQARGVAVYDIANPFAPELLDIISPGNPVWNDNNPGYEYAVWKNYVVMANVLGTDDCGVVSFEDPTYLRHVSYFSDVGATINDDLPGRARYFQFQDDNMFLGSGKYDMAPLDSDNDPTLELEFYEQSGEYLLPLGNLVVSAENTDQGNINDTNSKFGLRIFAHQANADTTPPSVYFHSPTNGAAYQHIKSRIGVVIHETLDYASINSTTFRVYPSSDSSGNSDVAGTLNFHDKDILTFTPLYDLQEETEYTVRLDAIKDVSGNAMLPYSFTFTTSGPNDPPPVIIDEIATSAYPAGVGNQINFTAAASGGSGGLEYRWDFGDGTVRTAWNSGSSSASHTYASEGHYTVKVQVQDSSGRYAKTASIVVTVVDLSAIPAASPSKASQIIVDETNRRVWTVNPDNNTVTVIDADTLAKVAEYGVSNDPRSLAQDASGRIWVACLDADMIDILDPNTGALVDGFACHPGSRPHDITFSPNKAYAFVSLKGSGHILRINASTMASTLLAADDTPTAIALNSAGDNLYLNRFISPNAQGEVRTYSNADTASFALNQVIGLQKDTVSEDTGDSGRGLPNYLADIVISPNNQFAYVSSKKDNIDRGIFLNGEELTFETTSRAIVSKINLSTGTEVFADRVDIDNASQPSALAFSPYGDYLFVALQGNNQIQVFDAFTEQVITTLETGLAPQGMMFDSTTLRLFIKNLNDRSVTVYDLADSLMYGWIGTPAENTISTVASELFDTSPGNNILLGKQIFYNAADERMSAAGYMSCAACHQDGDHDGRTWDFTDRGEGLRNTTNLRGRAGMAHGNVHWTANFDEIQDFEHDIRGPFAGTGFIDGEVNDPLQASNANRSADLDALAAYVASLGASSIEVSPYKQVTGELTVEAALGKQLFEGTLTPASGNALSCFSCHDPSTNFTDSVVGGDASVVLHDVGTIKASSGMRRGIPLTTAGLGIDTPTLLGVHASAPYFHDGSAETLEEVFDPSGNPNRSGEVNNVHDMSGAGSNLNSQELSNLIAFLNQLDGEPIIVPPPGTGPIARDVLLDPNSGSTSSSKVWTISDLQNATPTVTGSAGTATATGDSGSLTSSDNFVVTVEGRTGWSTSGADSASDFSAYLSSLTAANIDGLTDGRFGVVNSWIGGTDEAVVMTIDTSNLPSGTALSLKEIKMAQYTGPDRTDFVVWDSETNTIIYEVYDISYNGSDSITGDWELTNGDKVIVASGASNTNQFRINTMLFSITD